MMLTKTAFGMGEQLAIGEAHEDTLDAFFAKWYDIEPASRDEQRRGIDRHFTCRASGRTWAVEYKADSTAARTGRAFVETISVSTANKLGWAYTTRAQLVIFYIPPTRTAYVLPASDVKLNLTGWVNKYRMSPPVPNIGPGGFYYSKGVLVPLPVLSRLAVATFTVDGGNGH